MFPESYAPPGGNGLAARRKRKERELRGCEVYWRGFYWVVILGRIRFMRRTELGTVMGYENLVMICGSWSMKLRS